MPFKYYLLAANSTIWKQFAYEKRVSMHEVCLVSRDARRAVEQFRGIRGITLYVQKDWDYNLESSMRSEMKRALKALEDVGSISEIIYYEVISF